MHAQELPGGKAFGGTLGCHSSGGEVFRFPEPSLSAPTPACQG